MSAQPPPQHNNLFIDLAPEQIAKLDAFYDEKSEGGLWVCRFCKAQDSGPACLMAQAGSHRASAELRGKVNVIKLCRACHTLIQESIAKCKAFGAARKE